MHDLEEWRRMRLRKKHRPVGPVPSIAASTAARPRLPRRPVMRRASAARAIEEAALDAISALALA